MRDETADLAWAVEHLVQGPSGAPRPELLAAAREPASVAPAPLVYQLASPVPPSWFPLLPVKAADQSVALIGGTVEDGPRAPSGRLLPQLFSPDFQLPDREISRAGVVLSRVASRTRTADGGTRLWIARRKSFGAGEASSGLRYDTAQPAADAT